MAALRCPGQPPPQAPSHPPALGLFPELCPHFLFCPLHLQRNEMLLRPGVGTEGQSPWWALLPPYSIHPQASSHSTHIQKMEGCVQMFPKGNTHSDSPELWVTQQLHTHIAPGEASPCSLSLFFSCQVVSDSLQPHGLQHSRLLCPTLSSGVSYVHWVIDST